MVEIKSMFLYLNIKFILLNMPRISVKTGLPYKKREKDPAVAQATEDYKMFLRENGYRAQIKAVKYNSPDLKIDERKIQAAKNFLDVLAANPVYRSKVLNTRCKPPRMPKLPLYCGGVESVPVRKNYISKKRAGQTYERYVYPSQEMIDARKFEALIEQMQ